MRERAILWWRKISLLEKIIVIGEGKHLILGYSFRHPDSLTGREIEGLYTLRGNSDEYYEDRDIQTP